MILETFALLFFPLFLSHEPFCCFLAFIEVGNDEGLSLIPNLDLYIYMLDIYCFS